MANPLGELDKRLGRLEDVVAIHETLAGYGLTTDGGTPISGGKLWTEDCVYESNAVGANGGYQTRAGIEALIEAAGKAELGFAHITHLPLVVTDGDAATAYAASHLPVARDGGDFQISRVSANKWDLVRTDGQWQIQKRTSLTLDGSPESKDIFAEGARRAVGERLSLSTSYGADTNTEDDMSNADELAAMDRRIRELEDKLAILQVVAAYGPSVDGGAIPEAGSLWTENSWYDTDSSPAASVPHGRAGIEGAAARFLEDPIGLAHISHMPLIKVEGDRATVVNHSNTFYQDGDGFRIDRVSSNLWELVRVDGTWQIERRVNRLLDGSRASKDVLAEGTRKILGS